jgi:SsrA-binding protein
MKTVASNRRARFDYEILETIEAGIQLTGAEAKSCRMGHVDLAGSYVSFSGKQAVLKHLKIHPYKFARPENQTIERDRVLLLGRKDLDQLSSSSAEKGVSIVPLEVRAGKYIKIQIGIGRGRKSHDKRQAIREREIGKKLQKGEEI